MPRLCNYGAMYMTKDAFGILSNGSPVFAVPILHGVSIRTDQVNFV